MIALEIFFVLVGLISLILLLWGAQQLHQSKKLNREMDGAKRRAKEIDEMKSDFISLATHQIRTPLTAIKGYASMILEGDYGEINEKIKDPIETILKSTDNLVTILHEFLDISQIEQKRMVYTYSKFDLKDLIEDLIKEFKPNISQKGLNLEFEEGSERKYEIYADKQKIRQIISNIIDNAIKYTPEGVITIKLSKKGDKVLVEISDTGIGIPKDELEKIFEKFTRASDASSVNVTGTGLGMYIARVMMNEMGGKIWAESPGEGRGSSWFLEIGTKENLQIV